MTFASFVDILLKQKLLFRKISSFPDLYDCYASLDTISRKSFLESVGYRFENQKIPTIITGTGRPFNPLVKGSISDSKGLEFMLTSNGDDVICNADLTYCTCWHENDCENYAMWKIYLGNNPEGIAIKSTIGQLKHALAKEKEHDIFIGRANYCTTGVSLFDNTLNEHNVVLRKRKEYDYEKEIRVFFSVESVNPYTILDVNIDLKCLIDEIWISPFWPWGKECVERFLSRLELKEIKVQSSNIKEN